MFESKENKSIPSVEFKYIEETEWNIVSTEELFNNKKVIVFSLPGAFTPTCSSFHLPRYDELFEKFKELGVDDIIVMSVNDTFVMNSWKKDQKTKNIRFIPDGNGEFTKQMGMLVDKSDLGFGHRSWRYSMLVDNGIIVKQFIEPNEAGDPFKVSDADTMLSYLKPEKEFENDIVIFTQDNCAYCKKAKKVLEKNNLKYEEITIGKDISISAIKALTGKKSAPQIFIDGKYIGGSEELDIYFK